MKLLIIEDEHPAAEKLTAALHQSPYPVDIIGMTTSVAQSVEWLKQHPMPDLIFMDIELGDGQSFRIFDQVTIDCPVIFTTAYDEYWQEAFEHNSIDYLLKPVSQEKLDSALKKYLSLQQHFSTALQQLRQWQQQPSTPKKRFLIKRGGDYFSLRTEDIAWACATHKMVCLVDKSGQRHLLDKSLTELEKELDPAQFFRLNRKYLASINAIRKLRSQGKGKLLVELEPNAPEEVIVSSEQTAGFKEWMDA